MKSTATPALIISTLIHLGILGSMAAWKLNLIDSRSEVTVETIFSDERLQEEYTQELDIDTDVSENLNLVAGGVQSTTIGSAAAPAVNQSKIDKSDKLDDPQALQVGMIDMPSLSTIGTDLGEGEVRGEVGAHVDGYGAAMSRMAAEVLRHMRQQPVLAVWLFDASGSLADDRDEISAQFDKVYAELDIAAEQASRARQRFESLETVIASFGKEVKPLMSKPSGDLAEIRAAIDRVEEDESGVENVFQSINSVLDEYSRAAARSKRKLIVIVVSDESGDDADFLEETIDKAKRSRAPIYFLGREAIFGYPYAYVRVLDEATGLPVWPRVDRGPETAFPEAFQFNGFGTRGGGNADNLSSGFGPYAQVRLARESGGIFFLLGDVEETLGGRNRKKRQYDPAAMKEYEPLLLPVQEYDAQRKQSEFRQTIWEVIYRLNPHLDRQLNIAWQYPADQRGFYQEGKRQFSRATRAMRMLKESVDRLEKIRPLRDHEREMRWRAAYDLLYAQCLAYRVRLFQFMLAVDQHARSMPEPKKEKTNRWVRRPAERLLPPDEEQLKATGVTAEDLEEARRQALDAYETCIAEHPGTPWATRASQELRDGLGTQFAEYFHDPRYDTPLVKVPNL